MYNRCKNAYVKNEVNVRRVRTIACRKKRYSTSLCTHYGRCWRSLHTINTSSTGEMDFMWLVPHSRDASQLQVIHTHTYSEHIHKLGLTYRTSRCFSLSIANRFALIHLSLLLQIYYLHIISLKNKIIIIITDIQLHQ